MLTNAYKHIINIHVLLTCLNLKVFSVLFNLKSHNCVMIYGKNQQKAEKQIQKLLLVCYVRNH